MFKRWFMLYIMLVSLGLVGGVAMTSVGTKTMENLVYLFPQGLKVKLSGKYTSVLPATPTGTAIGDNVLVRGDQGTSLQGGVCTQDDSGIVTCTGYDSVCSPAQNTCGLQAPDNTSDCLAFGTPAAGATASCFISAIPHKHAATDNGAKFQGTIALEARAQDSATISSSNAETDLSISKWVIAPVTNRIGAVDAGGTMQLNGTGAFHYLFYTGQSGAETKVLDITASPTVASAGTAYRVKGSCLVRTSGASGVVECNGCVFINGVTPICAEQNTASVDLSGTPTFKTRVQFATSSSSNNLTEKILQFSASDAENVLQAATTTTTSTTSTSTSTTSTTSTSTTSTTIAGCNASGTKLYTGNVQDYWTQHAADTVATSGEQYVDNAASITICQVDLCVGNPTEAANSGSFFVDIYDNTGVAGRPGSKLGNSSSTFAGSSVVHAMTGPGTACGTANAGQVVSFTWSSGFPNPTTPFWIVLRNTTGGDFRPGFSNTFTAYKGTGDDDISIHVFDGWSAGSDKAEDMWFKTYCSGGGC